MAVIDPRQTIFEQIIICLNTMYLPYKWTRVLRLCALLGDKIIIEKLDEYLGAVEELTGIDIYTIETLLSHSDSLDNFIKKDNKRITELEIEKMFNEIADWLLFELNRVRQQIKFVDSRRRTM